MSASSLLRFFSIKFLLNGNNQSDLFGPKQERWSTTQLQFPNSSLYYFVKTLLSEADRQHDTYFERLDLTLFKELDRSTIGKLNELIEKFEVNELILNGDGRSVDWINSILSSRCKLKRVRIVGRNLPVEKALVIDKESTLDSLEGIVVFNKGMVDQMCEITSLCRSMKSLHVCLSTSDPELFDYALRKFLKNMTSLKQFSIENRWKTNKQIGGRYTKYWDIDIPINVDEELLSILENSTNLEVFRIVTHFESLRFHNEPTQKKFHPLPKLKDLFLEFRIPDTELLNLLPILPCHHVRRLQISSSICHWIGDIITRLGSVDEVYFSDGPQHNGRTSSSDTRFLQVNKLWLFNGYMPLSQLFYYIQSNFIYLKVLHLFKYEMHGFADLHADTAIEHIIIEKSKIEHVHKLILKSPNLQTLVLRHSHLGSGFATGEKKRKHEELLKYDPTDDSIPMKYFSTCEIVECSGAYDLVLATLFSHHLPKLTFVTLRDCYNLNESDLEILMSRTVKSSLTVNGPQFNDQLMLKYLQRFFGNSTKNVVISFNGKTITENGLMTIGDETYSRISVFVLPDTPFQFNRQFINILGKLDANRMKKIQISLLVDSSENLVEELFETLTRFKNLEWLSLTGCLPCTSEMIENLLLELPSYSLLY